MNIHRFMRWFAIITSFGAYWMVLLGTLVTTTGSGQGCGNSWPFCHGEIVPGVISIAGVIEYSHRVMAGVDGFLVLILTIATWFLYKKDFRVKLFGFLSLFFVVLQGGLGALTVVFEGTFAKVWLLAIHFGLSLIAFAAVILLTIRLFQIEHERQYPDEPSYVPVPKLQKPVWWMALYTFIVVYTGALVEHSGAVVACGQQYPTCGSTFLPSFTSMDGIQLLHRYFAGALWFLMLALLVVILRQYRTRRDLVQGGWWAFGLLTLQAASGATTFLTEGQMIPALIHATLITAFFSVLCFIGMQVGWPRTRKKLTEDAKNQQPELHAVSS